MTVQDTELTRSGHSINPDTRAALEELFAGLGTDRIEHLTFFASPEHDREIIAEVLRERAPGLATGCTTAGEIGPKGYCRDGMVVEAVLPGRLATHRFSFENVRDAAPDIYREARAEFDRRRAYPERKLREDCFGVLLVDGLSQCEERVVAALWDQFDGMPIVGGSAGDNWQFRAAPVFAGDRFLERGAALVIFEMGGTPFRTFRLQDFKPISAQMVVTNAAPDERIIYEIDGEPAFDVYAREIGLPSHKISDDVFSQYSLLTQIGGEDYIRSVRGVEGGGLSLHAAIDIGVVIRLGKSDETIATLAEQFGAAEPRTNASCMVFDCVHRQLELRRQGTLERAAEILGGLGAVGFSTYGEFADSVHVNQTMTGVCIG
ncbi:MAG: FIST N-terminal domain-containing protein [Planctomycetota bacterium]